MLLYSLHDKAKKSIRLVLLGTIFIMALFRTMVPSNAEENSNKDTIKVAFVNRPGLMEVNEDGTYSGYTYEYVMEMAQYAGLNVEFVFPEATDENEGLQELLQRTSNGDIDLIGSILYSDQLAQLFEYSTQNYGYTYTILSTLNSNSEITKFNLTNISQLRVAVQSSSVRRSELEDYCAENKISYTTVECETAEDQLASLNNGTADVMLTVSLSQKDGLKTVAEFAQRPFYFACSKGNTKLAERID